MQATHPCIPNRCQHNPGTHSKSDSQIHSLFTNLIHSGNSKPKEETQIGQTNVLLQHFSVKKQSDQPVAAFSPLQNTNPGEDTQTFFLPQLLGVLCISLLPSEMLRGGGLARGEDGAKGMCVAGMGYPLPADAGSGADSNSQKGQLMQSSPNSPKSGNGQERGWPSIRSNEYEKESTYVYV